MYRFYKVKQPFVVSQSNYERTQGLAQGERDDDEEDEDEEREWCD